MLAVLGLIPDLKLARVDVVFDGLAHKVAQHVRRHPRTFADNAVQPQVGGLVVEWENGDQILRGVREVVPVVRSAFSGIIDFAVGEPLGAQRGSPVSGGSSPRRGSQVAEYVGVWGVVESRACTQMKK